MIEYAEILYSLFELKYGVMFGGDTSEENYKKKSLQKKMEKKLNEMNTFGFEAADTYSEIYEFFLSEDYQGEKNADDYIQSIVNIKFSVAKV